MFTGMATGHPGMGTIHADSMEALINRLTTRPINLSPAYSVIKYMFLVNTCKIEGKAIRRVKEVVEITGMDLKKESLFTRLFLDGILVLMSSYDTKESSIVKRISISRGMTQDEVWEEINRRSLVLGWMAENNIVNFKDVGNIIKEYMRDQIKFYKNKS